MFTYSLLVGKYSFIKITLKKTEINVFLEKNDFISDLGVVRLKFPRAYEIRDAIGSIKYYYYRYLFIFSIAFFSDLVRFI